MGYATVIDLFCGPGGFSDGFEKAGFNVLLGIDINEDALDTFSYNHKKSKVMLEDIKNIHIENTEDRLIVKSSNNLCLIEEFDKNIDVVIGGIPCRASSNQSNGKNKESAREKYVDLYKEYIRIVKEINPKVFVIENVPEFITDIDKDGKNIYNEITSQLGLDGVGYEIKYKIINMANFGLPQKRERVIILGSRIGDIEFPDELVEAKEWVTVLDAISDLPEQVKFLKKSQNFQNIEDLKVEYPQISKYQALMRNKSSYIFNHIARNHRQKTIEKIKLIPNGGNWRDLPYKLLTDEDTFKEKDHFSNYYYRFEKDAPAKTIVTIDKTLLIHPIYDRTLSVREGARLQGFDDSYIFKGILDSQYQQIADAVSPIISECIANKIKEYI